MRDYLSGVGDAVAFYRAPPLAAESFLAKAREIGRLSATARYAVAGEVVRPVGQAARELLERVIERSGVLRHHRPAARPLRRSAPQPLQGPHGD